MATYWPASDGVEEQLPSVEWDQVSGTQPLVVGQHSEIRHAFMRLPGGGRVSVVLKLTTTQTPEEEGRVLHALAGVSGVPRLYGATRGLPLILVMSRCPGVSVRELWQRGDVRRCITALLLLCAVLSEVHARRVCHRDLRSGRNILLHDAASVYLIGFTSSLRRATATQLRTDVQQLRRLATDILEDMDKAFDPDIYDRRTEAMVRLSEAVQLDDVKSVLMKLMLGRRA